MANANITIVQATDEPAEQESLFKLYRSLLKPYIEPVFGWNEEFQRERFRLEYPVERTSLLLNDSRQAGFVVVTPNTESVHVSLLLLREKFQRLGIGSAVMRRLLLDAEAKQLPVTLSCFRSNTAALQFYEELGFSPVRQDETFVELTSAETPRT